MTTIDLVAFVFDFALFFIDMVYHDKHRQRSDMGSMLHARWPADQKYHTHLTPLKRTE